MKQVIMILLFFCAFTTVEAQTSQGQTINLDTKSRTPKTQEELVKNAKITLYKAIYKDVTYPVYVTTNNKYFIIVKAMTSGNWYRKYIKLDNS